MTDSTSHSHAAALAELGLHQAEFATLRDEILQLIESERQYLNLSIAAAGAGLGIAPFISSQTAFVLLLLPFIFHVLLWEMLAATRSVALISNYLLNTLIPRVNALLDKLGDDRGGTVALGWEAHLRSMPINARRVILASVAPTRHWVPILAIAVLIAAYLLMVRNVGYQPSAGELGLIFLNLALLILAAVQNARMAFD